MTIYRANANLIAQLPNSDLRREIVKVYRLLKVLTDFYKMNSVFLNERDKAIDAGKIGVARSIHSQLLEVAPRMKEYHDCLVGLMEDLLKILGEELSQCKKWDFRSWPNST